MRIALLSNVTVDLLAGMLSKSAEVYLSAGFDTWQQEMILSSSGLYDFRPDAVIVLLHANAYEDVWNDPERGEQEISNWCDAFQAMAPRMPGVPLFVSSLDVFSEQCSYGAEIRPDRYFENELIKRIEALHQAGQSIYVLPVKELVTDQGRKAFYSPKMWYVGSMPYSMKGLSGLNDLILRYAGAIRGAKKKCIALDLDNTLWGGVIGEDGVNGIQLSNHKEGARFRDAQKILKKMRKQGVMLAVLSKNNPEDVEPVFSHPDMILQHEDFVAEVINWNSKSDNIRQLAKDLNIGLDAFVFLDDNPVEREQMKAECPEVTVLEFPRDTASLPETVAEAYNQYFLSLEVTGEDTQKTAMYQAESRRKADMSGAVSVEDFLKKLEMKMDMHQMTADEEKRVTQLVNKTNQFNVTTKRYSEEEIHELANGRHSEVYTVHMADKYGEQGLVSVLILKYERETAEIDTFLMSCRVMGRDAEKEIMARLKAILTEKGIPKVKAAYVKSAKNAPVEGLFDRLGFTGTAGEIREVGDRKDYEAAAAALPEATGYFQEMNAGVSE